ncbi:glutathione S-transferase [Stella humosa]|uniref:Glutathione S-transferase n=1 Tax=Stella humosa TaxID=94 RepID=A0A3N1LXB9_9PROT|nr:glutathione S-transferase family protein [Stella humosa]ROP99833.1 glutathione S-transferase [Stella humosa]BBK30939.1 glutathione S-transferase [Stella humosa]
MADLTIYIGNKNYSSWSLRGWLMVKASGIEFDEVVIALDEPTTRETIVRHSPSGRVPAIRHGDRVVWDTLAIGEYLAEQVPAAGLWPADQGVRAIARAVSSEMHSGFEAMRAHFPMNMRSTFPDRYPTGDAQADINRIAAIWRDCRRRFGGAGEFLFGEFTIADAMFAPVCSRFRTYKIEMDEVGQAYCDAIWNWPAMQEWLQAARKEPMVIPGAEF